MFIPKKRQKTLDYKVLTKCMANRIKPVLQKLIHPDQTGFITGRMLGENILNIETLSAHLIKENGAGKGIMLILKKLLIAWNGRLSTKHLNIMALDQCLFLGLKQSNQAQ